jgi:chorismate synthase
VSASHPSDYITLRDLYGINEMVAAEHLQKVVWGSDDDFDNKDILMAIQFAGGLVAGAFVPSGELVGFIFAFPTSQLHVLHSHRLAVLPEWRSHGLGARLKWYQREWSLARGVELIHWTYDPLRTVNADLNIRCLGGTARTYYKDYYGLMNGINAGAPSDRILVDWQINSPRVVTRIRSPLPQKPYSEAVTANPHQEKAPGEEYLDLDADMVRVNIPEDFGNLLVENQPLALAWRMHTRRLLEHYFSRGYSICQFTRVGGPAYLLEK